MVGENSSSENDEILYNRASCYEHMGNVGLINNLVDKKGDGV